MVVLLEVDNEKRTRYEAYFFYVTAVLFEVNNEKGTRFTA